MGCSNSKDRPRTPPPDGALQSAVSDGDGFWAANGEQAAAPPTKPSPTKKPAIKPVMPGGRKKSKNNKKKKKGNKKK